MLDQLRALLEKMIMCRELEHIVDEMVTTY
jgi:hypothetical protein